jgi:hypothetical protein
MSDTGTICIDTPAGIDRWYLLSLYHGIALYLKTGMMARRGYTPANMREAASNQTGKKYARSRKGLIQAGRDLAPLLGKEWDASIQ